MRKTFLFLFISFFPLCLSAGAEDFMETAHNVPATATSGEPDIGANTDVEERARRAREAQIDALKLRFEEEALYWTEKQKRDIQRTVNNNRNLTKAEKKDVVSHIESAWREEKAAKLNALFDGAEAIVKYDGRKDDGDNTKGIKESSEMLNWHANRLCNFVPNFVLDGLTFEQRKELYPDVWGKQELVWNYNFTKKVLRALADNEMTDEERAEVIDDTKWEKMPEAVEEMWDRYGVPKGDRLFPRNKEEWKEQDKKFHAKANALWRGLGYIARDEGEMRMMLALSVMQDETQMERALERLQEDYGTTKEGQEKLQRVLYGATSLSMHLQGNSFYLFLKGAAKGAKDATVGEWSELKKLFTGSEQERRDGELWAIANRALLNKGKDVSDVNEVVESDEFKALLQDGSLRREFAKTYVEWALNERAESPWWSSGSGEEFTPNALKEFYARRAEENADTQIQNLTFNELKDAYLRASKVYYKNVRANLAETILEARPYENEWLRPMAQTGGEVVGYMFPTVAASLVTILFLTTLQRFRPGNK